jgi:hypothetical protein
MTNLLPSSIEYRATQLMLQGVEALEAVKMAIDAENKMIDSLFGGDGFLTERGKVALEYTANKFYNKVNAA